LGILKAGMAFMFLPIPALQSFADELWLCLRYFFCGVFFFFCHEFGLQNYYNHVWIPP